MANKTSDWKIIATAGVTIDARNISATWIKDMADGYSVDEYAALIWPEHKRSGWDLFEGKNWGIVEQLKAEEKDGKMRLFAKITPNKYLLDANKDGQKLFTSIEINDDYKATGKCYLTGLAVTDSPASTGTTLLKFSTGSGEHKEVSASQLEEISFSECLTTNPVAKAFATLAEFFSTGGVLPETQQPPQEEEPMDKQQFAQVIEKLDGIETKQTALEAAQAALTGKVDKFAIEPEAPEKQAPEGEHFTAEKFTAELAKQLKPITEKVDGLEAKFNALTKEAPGQRPGAEGAGTTMEAF